MKVKLQITATNTYYLETEDYADEWQQLCDDEGTVEEGNDYPPVTEDFALEQFQEGLESDDDLLNEVMGSATIDVRKMP